MARTLHIDPHSFGELDTLAHEVRGHWGWFVALGVAFILLSALAFSNVFAATLATVIFIAAMMIVAAVVHIVAAFRVHRWGAFFLWLLSGLLYGAAGILAFYDPVLAASAVTLALAFMMIFAGTFRIATGFRARPTFGWGWIVASGALTLLVGLIVAFGWPVNTLWILGLFLAIDLAFQGVATLAFGLALRSAR